MIDFTSGEIAFALVVWTSAFLLVWWHADKHGSKHPTAWGIAAFLAAGLIVPVYFIRYWLRQRRVKT